MNRTDSAAHEAGDLGRSLRVWRVLRRMKQGHAAELLGVSQATVSRWESGRQAPTLAERDALRALMAARLDGAADHALARLVRGSSRESHLICDLTHRLLAASPARERRWKLSARELMGTSMWRFHTEAIARAEAALPALGWYGEAPPEVEVLTGANESPEVPIRRGRCRWTRLRLSDGSYARLVETEAAA
jgi:transcriptional regulator with XRE-family HTH domain